jgi:hypothetical protein
MSRNTSSSSGSFTFDLDTNPPAALSVALTADSGSSPVDGITSIGTLDITGVEPGATVQYSIDGGTTWSSGFSAVEGPNSVQVRQADVAGNSSSASSIVFTFDTTAPVKPAVTAITDDTGLPDGHVTSDRTLIFSGTAEADSLVEVYVGGVSKGTAASDAAGNWSFDYSGTLLSVGSTYTISATAQDAAGNTSITSDPYAVSIDAAPPVPTIVLAPGITPDDVINIAEAGGLVAITGTVGGDAKAGDTVTLTVNGVSSTGLVQADGTTFTINVAGSDLAADTAINASVVTYIGSIPGMASTTESYTVDITAPLPTISLGGAITADDVINISEAGGAVAISGTVGGAAQVGDTVTLTVNGVASTGQVLPGNTFSIYVAGSDLAADTTITAGITSIDGAGNPGTASDIKSYTVDITPPAPTITLAANVTADNVINIAEAGATVAVTGSVGGDAKAGDTVTVTVNSGTFTGTFTGLVQADNSFSVDVLGSGLVDDADLTITASISTVDAAGNPGTATATNSYSVDVIAPAPTITLDSNITLDDIINIAEAGGSVAVTGLVGGDAQIGDTVTLTVNGNIYTEVLTGCCFGINVAGSDLAADPDHTVTAGLTTTDGAGNPGTASDSVSYTVDTVRPTAVIVVDDTALKIGDSANVTITFNEAVTGFTSADLAVANGTLSAVGSADGGRTWTAALTPDSPVEDPANIITLADNSVTDLAGNANAGATDSNSYAVDTIRPTVAIMVNDASLTIGETATTFTVKRLPASPTPT